MNKEKTDICCMATQRWDEVKTDFHQSMELDVATIRENDISLRQSALTGPSLRGPLCSRTYKAPKPIDLTGSSYDIIFFVSSQRQFHALMESVFTSSQRGSPCSRYRSFPCSSFQVKLSAMPEPLTCASMQPCLPQPHTAPSLRSGVRAHQQ